MTQGVPAQAPRAGLPASLNGSVASRASSPASSNLPLTKAPATPPATPILSIDKDSAAAIRWDRADLWDSLSADAQIALFRYQIRNAKNSKRLMLEWSEYCQDVKGTLEKSEERLSATPVESATPAKTPPIPNAASMTGKDVDMTEISEIASAAVEEIRKVMDERRREKQAERERAEKEAEKPKNEATRLLAEASDRLQRVENERAVREELNRAQVESDERLKVAREKRQHDGLKLANEANGTKDVDDRQIREEATRQKEDSRQTGADLTKRKSSDKERRESALERLRLEVKTYEARRLRTEQEDRERAQELVKAEARAAEVKKLKLEMEDQERALAETETQHEKVRKELVEAEAKAAEAKKLRLVLEDQKLALAKIKTQYEEARKETEIHKRETANAFADMRLIMEDARRKREGQQGEEAHLAISAEEDMEKAFEKLQESLKRIERKMEDQGRGALDPLNSTSNTVKQLVEKTNTVSKVQGDAGGAHPGARHLAKEREEQGVEQAPLESERLPRGEDEMVRLKRKVDECESLRPQDRSMEAKRLKGNTA
ncbi:hypothetical protein LZ554_007186 [Drepanopeziza brunnea f. sp. 'monogermtubi']|nr:hypothetical protein LZ554_007186 [Drepanopeziza brunnea f. sp. 'monogermtubi']